jgi:hypothetical protein
MDCRNQSDHLADCDIKPHQADRTVIIDGADCFPRPPNIGGRGNTFIRLSCSTVSPTGLKKLH